MGKADRLTTPIDLTKDLGIHKRKIYGILRKERGGGISSISGSGGNFVQITGNGQAVNLLLSNNTWFGTNHFVGGVCIDKLTCNLDMGGHIISNIGTPSKCGDVATKCYVDLMFQTAGFNQGAIIENISESPFVFYDPPSHVWSPYQNVYVFNSNKLSIKETDVGSPVLQNSTPVDPTPSGGITESETTTVNDDYIITFSSGTTFNIANASVAGKSLMPASYWNNTADLYIDGVFNKSITLSASGTFSTTFIFSGAAGTHTADMRFGGNHVYVSFVS